jgi:hypothetical protein
MRIPWSGPVSGQLVPLPPGEYDWIEMRFADYSHHEVEAEVWLHYADGADPEWLRRQAGAAICRIPVPRHATLVAFRVPDDPVLRPAELRLVAAARIKEAVGHD